MRPETVDLAFRARRTLFGVTGWPPRLVTAALVLWASPVIGDETTAQLPVKPGVIEPGPGPANPASVSLEQLSATRERPLFSPGRRPPQPQPVVHTRREPMLHPPPGPPNLTLIGVVLDTEEARAVVRTGTTVIRARMGDEIDGWKVTAIEARRLLLSNQDRSVAFALFAREHAGAAASSAPAPVAIAGAPPGFRASRHGPKMQ